MKRISASDAKNRFGGLLEEVAMEGRVDIVRHGRVVGVLLSPKAFDELAKGRELPAEWSAAHMIDPQSARAARIVKPPGGFDE